jgi:cyclase
VDRRRFIGRCLATATALPAATLLRPADAAVEPLQVSSLTDRISLIRGGGGNVVVFNSSDGVLLVDGGSPERSAEVLAKVRALTGAEHIHTLCNTHWHWEQTGSNKALGPRGTKIIAHENTRLWLGTEVDSAWQQHRVFPRLPPPARPTQTFYTTGTLSFGGEQIDYGHLPQAHTDGDIFVRFRTANLIACGDVVSVGSYPIIDYSTGGWLGGLAAAAKSLAAMGDPQTRYVPGSGPAQSLAEVQAESDMLATMLKRLAKLLAEGGSVEDMLAAHPSKEFDARWGDPTLFIANAWPGLVARARELGVAIV